MTDNKRIQEVYDGIFLNDILLPNNPLKTINNYVVKSKGHTLMVDTCFNTPESIARVQEILDYHQIDITKLQLVLTHLHADHTGLASWFEERGATVYMSPTDGKSVNDMVLSDSPYWQGVVENSYLQGLKEDQLKLENHPGFRFRPQTTLNFKPLEIGDSLPIGDYTFTVVDLKGHTPGMIGLYEKNHKILFCGDHILGKITPNITYWTADFDALDAYFNNLKKVRSKEVDHLFSAHRFLVQDHRARIDELLSHHDDRLHETLTCLKEKGPSTVREVTKNLSWDISAKSWDDFPESQKWFATGEAHSHLEYLLHLGRCQRQLQDSVLVYSLV